MNDEGEAMTKNGTSDGKGSDEIDQQSTAEQAVEKKEVAEVGEEQRIDTEDVSKKGDETAAEEDAEQNVSSVEAQPESVSEPEVTSKNTAEKKEEGHAIGGPQVLQEENAKTQGLTETSNMGAADTHSAANLNAENSEAINTIGNERDLPAPPTPSKPDESLPGSRDTELEDVARAFGASARIAEGQVESTSKENASTVSKDTPQIPASPEKPRGIRIGKGPPPNTQASEEKPFDFNRFLDQMRHKSAGPVGEYVRSFIKGFTKKPYRVADQTKLIFDFLDFIALRMRECEVWATLPQGEFENAMEAMEKLIMNRLYNYTFSPAIKREGKWSVQTDDLERDRVLKQRVRLFGWIDESHLEIPVGDHSKGFVEFAIQELLKLNHYKAPRDKVICILNCCKVIFGLIRHLSSQENADTFVPILIFVVLRANPDNLISNVEYISRFRNPERLSSESGYYLSSLMGAVAFIETMDYTSLSNITQQEFEANVEAAVLSISSQGGETGSVSPTDKGSEMKVIIGGTSSAASDGRNTPLNSAQMTPQGSVSSNEDGSRALPISAGAAALAKDTRAFIQRTGEAARVGFGASLGGGMSALGRLFQDGLDGPRTPLGTSPGGTSSGLAGPGTGHATPDSPAGLAQRSELPAGTARSRMWNLFGVDEDQVKDQQALKTTRDGQGANQRTISGSSLNLGSWGRNLRVDAESDPTTPQSEELRQGRFATLTTTDGAPVRPVPLSERLARSFESRPPPRTPQPPLRRESTDPYMVDDGEGGVRTPTDDGSDVDDSTFGRSNRVTRQRPAAESGISRSRMSDLSSYLPSFLTDSATVRTPQNQNSSTLPAVENQSMLASPIEASLDDDQAVQAAAQIDRAHIDAGVETLRSIFPDTDASVCRLVLENCSGDVQAAIDKLLEMS